MRPPLVAIFFMTYFHRAGGEVWLPRPPGSATVTLTGVRMVTRNTVVLTSPVPFWNKNIVYEEKTISP